MAADPTLRRAFGLPRSHRVTRERDFRRAYRTGRRARGRTLLVVGARNDLPHPRLGLSVGRRVWRHAARRNRVKRIFREAFRLERAHLPAGLDLVLVPAEPRLVPDLEQTRRELVRLARKVERRLEEAAAEGGSEA